MIEYTVDGIRESETIVEHDTPLVDAVRTSNSWIILGETGLYIIPNN